jgi:hypothetical protein
LLLLKTLYTQQQLTGGATGCFFVAASGLGCRLVVQQNANRTAVFDSTGVERLLLSFCVGVAIYRATRLQLKVIAFWGCNGF